MNKTDEPIDRIKKLQSISIDAGHILDLIKLAAEEIESNKDSPAAEIAGSIYGAADIVDKKLDEIYDLLDEAEAAARAPK